ncbi:cytochrome c oxidase accessory protein CcoG [Longibacter sp.]|jgi:cytochrome c oxidase accessory protein FixG|uniref:cytochrome c oxidase accessory protein CcoG n=1 Tax=Longibacter sp. TaxID=2045415 RepID=UPI003EBB6822
MEVTDRNSNGRQTQQFIPAGDVGVMDAPPEDIMATLNADGSRKWLYPELNKGRWYYYRLIVAWVLVAVFVSLPIIKINGKPAIFLDVLHREFTFFGMTFYPTDTLLLMLLMIGALVSVVLFTALLGRVWCGWACPQTVYLEFFYRPVERLFEGKEHVRKRRDEGPWSVDKLWRKAGKHVVYLGFSLALAHTFVAYFAGWDNLITWMQGSPADHWGYFVMMAGTTGLIMFDFGFFREQMCTIACPYARFQSVLLDPDSLIVSYDEERGEPRGKGKERSDMGDCVDCYACVRTCPTGIDIRDGLQMECLHCTQCIDACDDIMEKVGFEPGLIRYSSEREDEGKSRRSVRPRTVIYSLLMVLIVSIFAIAFTTRGSYDVNVGRASGEPFVVLPNDEVANRLRFRVRNQSPKPTTYTVEAIEPASATVKVLGRTPIAVPEGEMHRTEIWLITPPGEIKDGSQTATLRVRFENGTTQEMHFPLLGPSGPSGP